jgi:uncharacterized protein YqeY
MNIKTRLETDLKDAMRSNDDLRKRTLRMALAAIRMAEVEKGKATDENAVLVVLQKEVKTRNESISDAQRANRPDMVAANQAEISVLEAYLPEAFTPEELEELVRQTIAEVGATDVRQTGLVMKTLMPKLLGRATGDQVSTVARRLLD